MTPVVAGWTLWRALRLLDRALRLRMARLAADHPSRSALADILGRLAMLRVRALALMEIGR